MLTISSILAFNDNYIWLLQNNEGRCIVVDPGDSEPVFTALKQNGLILEGIFLTHHHDDHVGGVAKLQAAFPDIAIFAPNSNRFPYATHRLNDGDMFRTLNTEFSVISVPGHTRDHIAFYATSMVFCGDTLFSAGCGRLFEGTPSEMYSSLQRLATLPDETKVYSGHEYTLSNLNFAFTVEPSNLLVQKTIAWAKSQREKQLPTLPSTIGLEKAINPFLRCQETSVINAVVDRTTDETPIAIFAALRQWKDSF